MGTEMDRREKIKAIRELLEKEGLLGHYEVATFCHEPVLQHMHKEENGDFRITLLPASMEGIKETIARVKKEHHASPWHLRDAERKARDDT